MIMYSRITAPNAQQTVSRKDMLKTSKLRRRAIVVHDLYELERHARAAEPHAIADAQCDAASHRAVVDERAVGAAVLEPRVPVATHQAAVLARDARAGGNLQ